MKEKNLSLFEGIGIEIEYMIVDRETLDVRPLADELIHDVAGAYSNDYDGEDISWSNELVLHLVELKTTGPVTSLGETFPLFERDIGRINGLLEKRGCILMPTGAHPWMNPIKETRLWPHEYREIYATYDRIFDCRRHGWANLQSVHINLPFSNDDEFARLHTAIRLLIPLIPAIAASSPILEGRRTDFLDMRMEVYRTNAEKIPSLTSDVIPEAIFSRAAYEREIFDKLYADILPFDVEGVLKGEWLNARGAIARFERMAIEIRVADVQECPQADLALSWGISKLLRLMVEERWTPFEMQKQWTAAPLVSMLARTTKDAENAVIEDKNYLSLFGIAGDSIRAGELWSGIAEKLETDGPGDVQMKETFMEIIKRGTLASAIVKAAGGDYSKENLFSVYKKLCTCLAEDRLFTG